MAGSVAREQARAPYQAEAKHASGCQSRRPFSQRVSQEAWRAGKNSREFLVARST
jgi:hypothetical protein